MIKNDGTVITWGENPQFFANIPAHMKKDLDQTPGVSTITFFTTDDSLQDTKTISDFSSNRLIYMAPISIKDLNQVQNLFLFNDWAYAIKKDGTVWGLGNGTKILSGTGKKENTIVPKQIKNLSNIREVVKVNHSFFAIDNSGSVWSWGANENGELVS